MEEAFGHRPHYLMASRAEPIEGVLPLFKVRGFLGQRALISVPYACTAASARPVGARSALLEAAGELARVCGATYVELRHRSDQGLHAADEGPVRRPFPVPISSDDEENALAIPRKQRRMTRQGAKHGLRAEIRT